MPFASTLNSEEGRSHILGVLIGGAGLAVLLMIGVAVFRRGQGGVAAPTHDVAPDKERWRMPPLHSLPPARLSTTSRLWLLVLRGYVVIAAGLVLVRIATLLGAH